MRPLQSIAMGLVVIGLRAAFAGYDALPDPAGWVLVLLGVRGLPDDLPQRRDLTLLAVLAGVVSVPLWVPEVSDRLYDTHASLGWAANLPQLGFVILLCLVLARRAAADGDTGAAAWARTALTGFVVAGLLPVLVFGAGLASLEVASYVGATLALLLLIWLLFSWSSRPWILGTNPTGVPGPT